MKLNGSSYRESNSTMFASLFIGSTLKGKNFLLYLKKLSQQQESMPVTTTLVFGKKGRGCLLKQGFLLRIAVKILKFGTPQTIAIIVLKIEKFDVTLH